MKPSKYKRKTRLWSEIFAPLLQIISILAIPVSIVAAWVTHIMLCIQQKDWVLMVFGILVPPIGWLHGALHWFGVW